MGKSKIVPIRKTDKTQDARQILKNGIVNGMCVEKLIQMADLELCGNVEVMMNVCGTSNYFNCMEYINASNENECDIISLLYVNDGIIVASTTIGIDQIGDIDGCENADNPDNVLDINIMMIDGTKVTINVIY